MKKNLDLDETIKRIKMNPYYPVQTTISFHSIFLMEKIWNKIKDKELASKACEIIDTYSSTFNYEKVFKKALKEHKEALKQILK